MGHEYRENHRRDFKDGLDWARSVLGQPADDAVAASGMSNEDLDALRGALDDTASGHPNDDDDDE